MEMNEIFHGVFLEKDTGLDGVLIFMKWFWGLFIPLAPL